jgi:hypothetical protein
MKAKYVYVSFLPAVVVGVSGVVSCWYFDECPKLMSTLGIPP